MSGTGGTEVTDLYLHQPQYLESAPGVRGLFHSQESPRKVQYIYVVSKFMFVYLCVCVRDSPVWGLQWEPGWYQVVLSVDWLLSCECGFLSVDHCHAAHPADLHTHQKVKMTQWSCNQFCTFCPWTHKTLVIIFLAENMNLLCCDSVIQSVCTVVLRLVTSTTCSYGGKNNRCVNMHTVYMPSIHPSTGCTTYWYYCYSILTFLTYPYKRSFIASVSMQEQTDTTRQGKFICRA